jgi:hypothetical protein
MQIVETVTEFESMMSTITGPVTLIPIFVDDKAHKAINALCALCVVQGSASYLLTFDHNDALRLDPAVLNKFDDVEIWTPSKKILMHALPSIRTVYDIESIEYLTTSKVTEASTFYTLYHQRTYAMYDKHVRINRSLALMRHIEWLEAYIEHLNGLLSIRQETINSSAYQFMNEIAIPATQYLESSGVHVETAQSVAKYGPRINRYIQNDLLYSEYNLFTTTGRPSNKFGGVNFAALNKRDGSREMFTSRHDDGLLVMADFESFHLRLIADMIGFELPTDIAVHEYLGRQYFDVAELTPEQYEEGKQITFRLLYGDDRDTNVPEFFTAVYKYIDMLTMLMEIQGYITSPYYKRAIRKSDIESPTPAKIFNYMVQLAETELNLAAIHKLQPIYQAARSKLTLYTYDAILIDYSMADGKELLNSTLEVLSHGGRFPMRVYYGNTYQEMKKLSR